MKEQVTIKNKIIFYFDDEKDAKEVMEALSAKQDITWFNDTKKAMMKPDKSKMTVLVSKSINQIPKPIRL